MSHDDSPESESDMDSINRQSRIGLAVLRGQREIREDIERGVVPAGIGSFSELHDYVDANEYGGVVEWARDATKFDTLFTEEDIEDANEVQDRLDIWIKAGALDWTTQAVDLAGVGPKDRDWIAQFRRGVRWNGWIGFPFFDALTVVEILDFVNEGDSYYGYDWDFAEDGTLIVQDRQFRTEYPDDFEAERIEPDEDGLYSLGAYGWVWSEKYEEA